MPRLVAGGAVLVALTGTAACGAQALEPKLALRDAFVELAEDRAGGVELSIASSADEIRAFAESADPEADADLSDDVLDTVLSSSLDLAYDFGEDADDTDDAAGVVVRIDDLVAGELRSIGYTAYARADLDGLAERFPEMQQGLDEFRSGLTGEDGVSGPAPEEIRGPATALLDGDWVSVDVEAYLAQLEELSGGAAMPEDATQEMRDLLGEALKGGVTAVERRASDENGDHLVATVDVREVWGELKAGLPGLYDEATAAELEKQLPTVDAIPDLQIDVSFWVRDGELRRAELDVAQFVEGAAGSFVLRADLTPAREITAPDGAVEVDLEALTALGMSELPGDGTEGGIGAEVPLDAYTVATWIDMDLAATAYEQGGETSVALLPDVLPYYDGLAPDLAITAVGEFVQVAIGADIVCLAPSEDGFAEDIAAGPC
ncbi:hypothetical protein [Blastococcus litoris]|uniref:hypothetical protein n=1 Tax=Blastococcus litoris TaxID=2171622 RepID=UPI0013DEF07B|nr:hypothetical protein [Blastococcus litoris]